MTWCVPTQEARQIAQGVADAEEEEEEEEDQEEEGGEQDEEDHEEEEDQEEGGEGMAEPSMVPETQVSQSTEYCLYVFDHVDGVSVAAALV